jgi:hypothetical protein
LSTAFQNAKPNESKHTMPIANMPPRRRRDLAAARIDAVLHADDRVAEHRRNLDGGAPPRSSASPAIADWKNRRPVRPPCCTANPPMHDPAVDAARVAAEVAEPQTRRRRRRGHWRRRRRARVGGGGADAIGGGLDGECAAASTRSRRAAASVPW